LLALVKASECTSNPIALGGLVDSRSDSLRRVRFWFASPGCSPQTR
jgi:hypothetical protein